MTANYGHKKLESIRERDAHPGPAGAVPPRRKLPKRACAGAGRSLVWRAEGAAKPRGRWHRGGAVSWADPRLSDGSSIFRSRCPQAVPAPADGARAGASTAGRGASSSPAQDGQAPVKLSGRTSLGAVAAAVAGALRSQGIPAVLTGGACAALYSEGAYHSKDLDFIVVGHATRAGMDTAMASIGFSRRHDRYVHPHARFYVEFPSGPLAISGEHRIDPVTRSTPYGRILMLSATDSCRDRLAAFYHWRDRQSLTVAAWIAARNRVNLGVLRRWSTAEGMGEQFGEFVVETRRVRRRMAPRRPSG